MSEKNDGGPAFPIPPLVIGESMWDDSASDGMSLRDYIAVHSLPVIASGLHPIGGTPYLPTDQYKAAAFAAYALADAMLAARDVGKMVGDTGIEPVTSPV